MTESIKKLMIHVETLVRPVRATESRKLKMRRELLAHLTEALEEERAAGGSDAEALEPRPKKDGARRQH